MLQHRNHRVTGGPACSFARGLLACLALSLPGQAVQADAALYQAVVPVRGATEADRATGFSDALRVAAVRVSGQRDAAANARINAAAADPGKYIQQYSTTTDRMLKVGFDGPALEQLLQQAGLPIWPAERPQTMIYLFVPTVAGGARAVTTADYPPERVELERVAQVRGVPLGWPSEAVDAETARAQAKAGASFAGAILTGQARGSGFDWSFGHAGQVATKQGASPAEGLDLAADTLAARYAPPSTRGVRTIEVRVGGLAGVRGYASLTRYLQGLSLVRSVEVEELVGDTVHLRLDLQGDLELLRRIAALEARLVSAPRPPPPAGGDTPDFLWQP